MTITEDGAILFGLSLKTNNPEDQKTFRLQCKRVEINFKEHIDKHLIEFNKKLDEIIKDGTTRDYRLAFLEKSNEEFSREMIAKEEKIGLLEKDNDKTL